MLSLLITLGDVDASLLAEVDLPVLQARSPRDDVRPSLTWTHPQFGRTIGRRELARVASHAAAWEMAADAEGAVLIVEAGAQLTAAQVRDAVHGDDWAVIAIDGTRAYAITPDAAASLLDPAVLADAVPLDALFGIDRVGDGDGDDITGGGVTTVNVAADDDVAFSDHVALLQIDDRRELADALAELDPYALVIAVTPHHRVLADAVEIASVYAQVAEGMVLLAASRYAPALDAASLAAHPETGNEYRYVSALGVAGPAALVADVLLGRDELDDTLAFTSAYLEGSCAIDSACALFHVVDPDVTDAVVVHPRVVNGATDTWPTVVVAADAAAMASMRDELDGGGSRDLARVFRYDDAVDLSNAWRVVANDIVEVPFWTPEFCATIIRLAEAAEAWDVDADDPVPGSEVSLAALAPRLFGHVQAHVDARVMPVLKNVWPEMAHTALHDAFVIKYAVGGSDELRLHHDVAHISASVKLCDTYRGGRLEFPRQGWHNRELAVGPLAVWPSLVTHPHRSTPVEAGVKYGVTLWWKLPQ